MVKKGWYILNYHNITSEVTKFDSLIGGSFTPSEFLDHLDILSKRFSLVSIQEGLEMWNEDRIDRPILSLWFDDGFIGTRLNAFPILSQLGLTAAISINSSFVLGTEVFWRHKISFLLQSNKAHKFKKLLADAYNYRPWEQVTKFCLDNFTNKLLNQIDELFDESTSDEEKLKAKSLFDTPSGLELLFNAGWLLTNHSANHLPIAEDSAFHLFQKEFHEAEYTLSRELNVSDKYIVLPFDRPAMRNNELFNYKKIYESMESKVLVTVGDAINFNHSDKSVIQRISVDQLSHKQLIKKLKKL